MKRLVIGLLLLGNLIYGQTYKKNEVVVKDRVYYNKKSNSVITGEVVDYYKNGDIKSKSQVKNGILDGEVITYDENKNIKIKLLMRRGKLKKFFTYYDTGELRAETISGIGNHYGKSIIYYKSGVRQKEKIQKDNKLVEELDYYEDGKLKSKTTPKGKNRSQVLGYYKNGKIKSKTILENRYPIEIVEYRGGVPQKIMENGKILKKNYSSSFAKLYKEEELERKNNLYYEKKTNKLVMGKLVYYYKNGKLRSEYEIKDGIPHGRVAFYYENGKLSRELTKVKGVNEGVYRSYYDTGELKIKGVLKNGKLLGKFKSYYKSGKLESEATYKGEKLFEKVNYLESGEVDYKIVTKKDGKQEKIIYSKDGKIKSVSKLKDGLPEELIELNKK